MYDAIWVVREQTRCSATSSARIRNCAYSKNDTPRSSPWLGEEHQGKGLVTAACLALVDHAFGDLGLNRMVISCATENEKSCAIPERLGFRQRAFSARLSGSTITSLIMWFT